MSGPIRRVTIRGFRGVGPELTVELAGRSLLLRGDNGSGKSSIGDALRWALTTWGGPFGHAPSLRHRALAADEVPRVTVELSAGGRIERSGEEPACDEAGLRFRDGCIRANPFFRRKDLQDLLSQGSTDRFAYLKSFFDLHQADGALDALSDRCKAVRAQRESRERELRASIEVAAARFGGRLQRWTAADLLHAARACVREHGVQVEEGADWLPILERCRDAALLAGSPAAARRKREVAEALDAHAALVPPELPARTLDTLRAAQARLEGVDVSGLLQRALDHVRAHPAIAECPVCQQGVEPTALTAELERRIASLEEIRAAKTAAHDLADRWRAFLDDVEELERVASSGDAAPATRLGGLPLLEALDADRQALSPRIVARLQGLRTKLTDELGALGAVDRAPALARLCDGLEAAASDVLTIDVERAEIDRLQHLEDRLGDVVKALTAARKAVFEQQCTAVRDVFAQYYEVIHPPGDAAEVTRAPRLTVTNRAKGTAVFDGIFDGQSVGDPRHFYSEGHLDTVAICLFLALRRVRANRDAANDPRFMALDDVILSIDIGHAGRLVRLIADQFKDHQILVLSHNEYFMQLCRGPLHDAQRLDIRRWTYEGGPSIGRCLRNTERLRRTLDEGSTSEQIASDIRPVLDELLAVATEGFNVSVPARRSGHTIADLWNPLQKFLRREATRLELGDLSGILARLDALQLIRNALGAHRNEWALQGDVGSVRELALALLELVERLECTTCRTIVHMRHPHHVAVGLACECGKNARPTLRRQIAAPQSVEGA